MTNSPSDNIKCSLFFDVKNGSVFLKIQNKEGSWEEVDSWSFEPTSDAAIFALGYAEALNSMENTDATLLEVEEVLER